KSGTRRTAHLSNSTASHSRARIDKSLCALAAYPAKKLWYISSTLAGAQAACWNCQSARKYPISRAGSAGRALSKSITVSSPAVTGQGYTAKLWVKDNGILGQVG